MEIRKNFQFRFRFHFDARCLWAQCVRKALCAILIDLFENSVEMVVISALFKIIEMNSSEWKPVFKSTEWNKKKCKINQQSRKFKVFAALFSEFYFHRRQVEMLLLLSGIQMCTLTSKREFKSAAHTHIVTDNITLAWIRLHFSYSSLCTIDRICGGLYTVCMCIYRLYICMRM